MNLGKILLTIFLVLVIIHCSSFDDSKSILDGKRWHAIHLLRVYTSQHVDTLINVVPRLSELGLNVIILEIDFNYKYESHPELILQNDPITKEKAALLVKICKENGIRIIPMFQCLGHQSWAGETYPLLTKYPEFDITPSAYPNNDSIYCREWDPLNPKVNQIVFELLDELIDAFDASAFHVGMDEVFLLGDDRSPTTKGKDPAILFAKAVNDLHHHLVKKRGVEMLMWSDRFIDGEKYDFGEWQSSLNGTARAIDMVPRDIIMCPWHYEDRKSYPSVPMFLAKGFRVLPASYEDTTAVKSLITYSYDFAGNEKMLGHLFTTWSVHAIDSLLSFNAIKVGMRTLERIESEIK